MNRIPIESATKAEIIEAIRATTVYWEELKARIENHLYHAKCSALLAELHRLNAESEKWQQIPGQPFDQSRRAQWLEIHDQWDRVNKQLSKLQGV